MAIKEDANAHDFSGAKEAISGQAYYEKYRNGLEEMFPSEAWALLNILVREKSLDRPFRVLDIGCAHGGLYKSLRLIADAVGVEIEYVGLDFNEESVAAASKRFPEATFLVGDASANDTRFEDRSFDLVACLGLSMANYIDVMSDYYWRVTDKYLLIDPRMHEMDTLEICYGWTLFHGQKFAQDVLNLVPRPARVSVIGYYFPFKHESMTGVKISGRYRHAAAVSEWLIEKPPVNQDPTVKTKWHSRLFPFKLLSSEMEQNVELVSEQFDYYPIP